MSAETELNALLPKLKATQRPGRFAVVGPMSLGKIAAANLSELDALIVEDEGWTAVAKTEICNALDWPVGIVFAWLTLDVHSSMSTVGLTAKVSTALAEIDIPANMIAAYHHDHILVPLTESEAAIACIERIGQAHGESDNSDGSDAESDRPDAESDTESESKKPI